jgi:hypothetical protein
MSGSYLRRLKTFDSVVPYELQMRSAGVGEYEFLVEGNSILSTVFIETIDLGATLLVEYTDTTTGRDVGEVYALAEHRVLNTALDIDRITITRIHNKPKVKYTLTGGSAKFSIYITVVSTFASDLDNALQLENSAVNLFRHKGIPIAALETTANVWSFLRTLNGKLQVDVANVLQTTQQLINKRLFGESLTLAFAGQSTLITYTVPEAISFYLLSGYGTSDTFGLFEIYIDGVKYLSKRNSWNDRNAPLFFDAPIKLLTGQILTVVVKNESVRELAGNFEAFIFGAEEIVLN